MEEVEISDNEKVNILEQSYCEGLKRITHRRNINFFHLSQNIIKRREKAWSELFDKYEKEIDDYEIKMYNSGSDVDDDEKDMDNKSEKDADDVDEKLYFIKNRTPIRKLPALVQYWVDTGNPPFQLNLENDDCESSLSEDQKSSPLIIHAQSETEGKRDHSTSFLSSVDTAAYILSNTNVTKKADTLAIVEGAKKSDSPIEASNISLNASKDCTTINKASNTQDENNRYLVSGRTSIHYINGTNLTALKSHLLTALDPDNIKNKKLISSESCDKSLDKLIMETSVKITDVLPTLEQLDKKMNGNTSDNDDKSSNIISWKDSHKSSQSQPFARKKLYTNRESPIDVILSDPKNNFKPRFSENVLHPALQCTPTINASRLYFRRRTLRYSKKRKSIANNKSKRLRDKSYFDSPNIKKSSRKRSSAKLTNSNHYVTNNSRKNSGENDDQTKNDERKEDHVELCKKKKLVVRLERILDEKIINGKVLNTEKPLNLSKNLFVGVTKSNIQTSKDYANVLELDSQESDQSTIIICECNDKSNLSLQEDNQTYSENESMHSEDEHNKKSKKQSTESVNEKFQNIDRQVPPDENKIIVNDDDSSDIFIGKLNKVTDPSVLSEILAMSNKKETMSPNSDKSKQIKVNIQSPSPQKSNNSDNSEDHSRRLRLTFSSDEEDDFIKMIRQKTGINKIRQTQNEDKSTKDANKTEPIVNNSKNESNLHCKFGVIASSDDDEEKIIKVDKIFTQKRKSLRIHSRSKKVETVSSDDEAMKIETTGHKRKSTKSYSKKFNKHSGKAIVKSISPQNNTKEIASHINVELNYSELDALSENITPPKKLKTIPDDMPNGNKKQTMNDTNSINAPMISLKEDFSLNKKNLNDLIKRNLTMKPDQTIRSKRQRRSNLKNKKDSNVFRNGDHENKCSPKKQILMKEFSISIVKCSNPSEDVVDSGLSSIVSSNDKRNKKLGCSDHSKSGSPVEKQNENSPRSSKRKSNRSRSIQRSASKSVKKFNKKHKSISVSNESDSENDLRPRTRRQSAINKSNSSNPTNAQEKRNFDDIFPDPINDSDVLDMPVFSSRSKKSREKHVEKNHKNKTLSNSGLKNGKIKFHTGMSSDSD